MCSRKGTRFVAVPPTLSLIPSMPGTASGIIAPASMENVRVYLVITVSTHIDIVCKWVAKVVKDIWAIDHQLSKLKGFLSEIKDELAFIRCGITILIHNTGLLDIELK